MQVNKLKATKTELSDWYSCIKNQLTNYYLIVFYTKIEYM